MRTWSLADFDFDLPPDRIAQHPAAQRSASRLLDARACGIVDRHFSDLPDLLREGDLLVFNDTQVLKARMFGRKPSAGRLELLIERVLDTGEVLAHMRVSKKPAAGTQLLMDGGFVATVLGRWPEEHTGALFRLRLSADPWELMAQHGHMPLPPYITHAADASDELRYQSIFARHPGAVAAPTAALHFDAALLCALEARGVQRAAITLHVGAGTFQPVKTHHIAQHRMHSERYHIPEATVAALADCRARGGRIVAVGTTSVRALESWAQTGQRSAETRIFITPGHHFRTADLLLTNFHLPKSTLMMLVAAFAGHAHIMALYRHAIAQHYRFFSYGDAMLLQRAAEPSR